MKKIIIIHWVTFLFYGLMLVGQNDNLPPLLREWSEQQRMLAESEGMFSLLNIMLLASMFFYIISTIGLFFYKEFFKYIFALHIFINFVTIYACGHSVEHHVTYSAGTIYSLVTGILLVISFQPSTYSHKFNQVIKQMGDSTSVE